MEISCKEFVNEMTDKNMLKFNELYDCPICLKPFDLNEKVNVFEYCLDF